MSQVKNNINNNNNNNNNNVYFHRKISVTKKGYMYILILYWMYFTAS